MSSGRSLEVLRVTCIVREMITTLQINVSLGEQNSAYKFTAGAFCLLT